MKKLTNSMYLKIHGIIYALFAIGLFFIPVIIWPSYGLELNDDNAIFLSQHTSIFLGGVAMISILLQGVEYKSDIAQKLFLGLTLTNLLGVIITLYACIEGLFSGLGWSDPAFFALMTVLSYLKLKDNK